MDPLHVAAEVDLTGIDIDTSAPVLVTGATGYLAGWIVAALLHAGVTVHAAVRDPDRTAKVQHLLDIAASSPGELTLFAADLLREGSYTEAMQGCRIVFHTASPFVRNVEDPQRDLVDPAVRGTHNVLTSANEVESVQRVVLTSSIAAMYTDAVDAEAQPGGRLTENIWNTTASLTHEPYSYSKTLAEKEAWKLAKAQDRWRLVVINPAFVIGPSLNADPTSESFSILKQMGRGDMRLGAPRLAISVVDVRDVARAEIAAAYFPDVQGRHIVSGHDTDFLTMGFTLLPEFGRRYPLPRWAMPKRLFWLVAPAVGVTRDYVDKNVDHVLLADNAKSRERLGMAYRPMSTSLNEMFAQMVDQGAFATKK